MPGLILEATDDRWWLGDSGVADVGEGDVLAKLDWLTRHLGLAKATESPDPDLPPFQGGLIGYIGYDFAPQLERLPRRRARDSRMPDIRLAFYNTAVTVDHRSGLVQLWSWIVPGRDRATAERVCRCWKERIERELDSPRRDAVRPLASGRLVSSLDRHSYLEAGGAAWADTGARARFPGRRPRRATPPRPR